MMMTKPLYKRDWFLAMSTGLVLATVGFYFIVSSILSSSYDVMSVGYGIFFGMGLTDFIAGAAFYNYEKRLDAKTNG